MNTFSISEAFHTGWELFKKRPGLLIGAGILYLLAVIVISAILNEIGNIGPVVGIAAAVLKVIVDTLAGMGMTAFLLKAHDDLAHAALHDLWHPEPFWYFIGASILVTILVLGGLILLIIPGVIFSIVYAFATYAVIDHNLSPMNALRESARITRGHRWALLWFFVLSVLLNVVGLLAVIVGLLVTVPVTSLAFVHAYRVLQKQHSPAAPFPAASVA